MQPSDHVGKYGLFRVTTANELARIHTANDVTPAEGWHKGEANVAALKRAFTDRLNRVTLSGKTYSITYSLNRNDKHDKHVKAFISPTKPFTHAPCGWFDVTDYLTRR